MKQEFKEEIKQEIKQEKIKQEEKESPETVRKKKYARYEGHRDNWCHSDSDSESESEKQCTKSHIATPEIIVGAIQKILSTL